jgi:hypothetical protein
MLEADESDIIYRHLSKILSNHIGLSFKKLRAKAVTN